MKWGVNNGKEPQIVKVKVDADVESAVAIILNSFNLTGLSYSPSDSFTTTDPNGSANCVKILIGIINGSFLWSLNLDDDKLTYLNARGEKETLIVDSNINETDPIISSGIGEIPMRDVAWSEWQWRNMISLHCVAVITKGCSIPVDFMWNNIFAEVQQDLSGYLRREANDVLCATNQLDELLRGRPALRIMIASGVKAAYAGKTNSVGDSLSYLQLTVGDVNLLEDLRASEKKARKEHQYNVTRIRTSPQFINGDIGQTLIGNERARYVDEITALRGINKRATILLYISNITIDCMSERYVQFIQQTKKNILAHTAKSMNGCPIDIVNAAGKVAVNTVQSSCIKSYRIEQAALFYAKTEEGYNLPKPQSSGRIQ